MSSSDSPTVSAVPQTQGDLSELENEKFSALLYVCEDTQQWIVQADTKGSFLLTINGVATGFMAQKFVQFMQVWNKGGEPRWAMLTLFAIFLVYMIAQVYSFWHTASVFVPRTTASSGDRSFRSRHIFNYSLSQSFPRLSDWSKLRDEYRDLSVRDLEHEYIARLQVDSLVCSAKYESFLKAFHGMLCALGFAFFGVLGTLLLLAK